MNYTYERDDGLVRSWIDHILCSKHISSLVIDIHAVHSGSLLSDHFPLFFKINLRLLSLPPTPPSVDHSVRIDWSKATSTHIQRYCDRLSACVDTLPSDIISCVAADCTQHQAMLDLYAQSLISSMLHCASECFPTITSKPRRRLAGWNDSAGLLKKSANFWCKVWEEAACPKSGVPFQIKKCTKTKYKYEIRRLKRRQTVLLQKKLAALFARKNRKNFWSEIRHLNRSYSCPTPVVDGISGSTNIANLFAFKSKGTLNTHSSSLLSSFHSDLQSTISDMDISEVSFSDYDVLQAISKLKSKKLDGSGVFSEHLKYASSAISESLAGFFTSVIRHGYMPFSIRNSLLTPIPKANKNTSCSSNYRAIALASNLSKLLEHLILDCYESYFCTSHLQYGFKPGLSTSMCTGTLKNVVSRYINRGSSVLGCFLDASKAFDMVDHRLLFGKLRDKGLPLPVIRLLSSWYRDQQLCVKWDHSLSNSFGASNGVRQGSVLSPVLFSVYLDGLLERLSQSAVGCYWGHQFAGALCYADDIVLLAPCASALRQMLGICSSYATWPGI